MKIIPTSRGGRTRLAALLIALAVGCAYARLDRVAAVYLSDLREGDIVFQSLPHAELVDAIEGVTESEWSHCGMLVIVDGHWCVAEAIGEVRYTPLYMWVSRGRGGTVASYRLKQPPPGLGDTIRSGVEPLLRRPYDFRYAPEDNEIYCSELVHKVYDRALGLKIGEWQTLGSLNWRPFERVIRDMEGGELPLDRSMITPVELTRSALVERVY